MSAQVQPFVSTVTGTLDAKGRVCIPATFRQVLAGQGTVGVNLVPSFIEPCLEGFGEDLLQSITREIAAVNPFFTKNFNARAAAIVGEMRNVPLDENGRVRLPDEFIAHAGLKDQVVFLGLVSKFQIWEPERYAAVRAARLKAVMDAYNAEPGTTP